MLTARVSCFAGLVYDANQVGGSGGRTPPGKQGRCGDACRGRFYKYQEVLSAHSLKTVTVQNRLISR